MNNDWNMKRPKVMPASQDAAEDQIALALAASNRRQRSPGSRPSFQFSLRGLDAVRDGGVTEILLDLRMMRAVQHDRSIDKRTVGECIPSGERQSWPRPRFRAASAG